MSGKHARTKEEPPHVNGYVVVVPVHLEDMPHGSHLQEAALRSRTYTHSPDMGEISGFGGAYEASCQAALDAGVKWLEKNGPADLRHDCEDTLGNRKSISDAMDRAVEENYPGAGLTGAQFTTVMERCRWIQHYGWNAYVEWMKWIQYHRELSGGTFHPPGVPL